ncbi:hypothetical protein Ccrd_016529 [Cynara cardunculus var. scolymus]|uniref:Uncharacterized protein n=1 Tax=Cynara cardunculus var. scolymus TaxID=59895 RepID=A0A103Y9V0_CYNCS|nr:hypothetical protein Ccrd_016529 [Cynara cardunculus var. scolymus]
MVKRKQGNKEKATDMKSQRMELKLVINGIEYMGELSGDKNSEKKRKYKGKDLRNDAKMARKEKSTGVSVDSRNGGPKRKKTSSDSGFETPCIKNPKRIGKVKPSHKVEQLNLIVENNERPRSRRKYNGLRTRTSPKTLFLAIHSLSTSQRQCVEEMGFGKILDMKVDGIPSKLGFYVVDRFDEKKMEIRLENGSIKITKDLIHDMLGVPNGGVELHSLQGTETDDTILKEWKKQYGKTLIRPADVMREIIVSEDAGLNFKLNFLILISNTMAEGMKMGICNLNILSYIREDTVIHDLDWCSYIWDCLKVSKLGWKRDADISFYTGPLTFLTLLYLDATKCKKVTVVRQRPAIKCWSMELMRQREFAEIDTGGFGLGDFEDPFELTRTDDEGILAIEWGAGYLLKIDERFSCLMAEKTKMESTLREAMTKYPGMSKLKEWETKLEALFGGKSDVNGFTHRDQATMVPENLDSAPKCIEEVVDAHVDEGDEGDEGDEREDNEETKPQFWINMETHSVIDGAGESVEKNCRIDNSVLPNYDIGLTQELVNESSFELLLSEGKSVHEAAISVEPLSSCYEEKTN